jgi:hypothetical protein
VVCICTPPRARGTADRCIHRPVGVSELCGVIDDLFGVTGDLFGVTGDLFAVTIAA